MLNCGSDGGALTTQATGVKRWGVVTYGRRPIRKFPMKMPKKTMAKNDGKEKSPPRISPRGLDDFCDGAVMPLICPTGQTFFLRRKRNAENSMKRVWLDETDICDDGCVPLICRTRQVHRLLHWRRIEASN
jgi:hypothetical protein